MREFAIARVVTGLLLVAALSCSVAHGDQNQELIDAAFIGDLKQVKDLLDEGADVHAKDAHGVTALWLASKFNHPDVVRLLLDNGAEVNAKDKDGVTALIEACSFEPSGGKLGVVRLLLERGADVNAKDNSAVTALMHASSGEDDPDIVRLLLDKGADPNAKDDEGKTALIWAAGWGDVEAARRLLGKGSDLNAKDNEGGTALKTASDKGHIEMVELLKAHGATAQGDNQHLLPGQKAPVGPYIIHGKARESSTNTWPGLDTNSLIDISSKKFAAKNIPGGKEASFEGNVRMTQGDTTLTCDQLVMVYSETSKTGTAEGSVKKFPKGMGNGSPLKRITASGNVKIVQTERMTVARKVICDIEKGTITIMK